MRRATTLPLALTLVLVAMLGFAPGMLAKQEETPIPDPAPSFEDIFVTCDVGECELVEGRQQTYTVDFAQHSYIPELAPDVTADEVIVVRVLKGTLAFRVQTADVIVDPQGTEISMLTTFDNDGIPVTVPFGQTPSMVPDDKQPEYIVDPTKVAECSQGPLQDLCLLNPTQFADQMTFVQLEQDYIVYLPAGSTCFICNVTDTNPDDQESGDTPAKVQVWAPGSGFSWFERSQEENSNATQATPSVQGSSRIVGWMFNPGSRCN
jgi:hypothetical protein